MTIRHPWRGLEGLPRQVWTLCIATFIHRSGTMVLPFLVLYLTQNRGLGASRAGAALTVYGIGSLLGQPLAGKLADRFGAPRLVSGRRSDIARRFHGAHSMAGWQHRHALALGALLSSAGIVDAWGLQTLWPGAFAFGCVSVLLLSRLRR